MTLVDSSFDLAGRPDLLAALTDRPLPRFADAAAACADRPTVTHPHAPGLDIVGQDALVPLVGGGEIAYANLDHAASAPALRVVHEAVERSIAGYASVHRGAGWHSKLSTALYEGAREPVRAFVGGRADDTVIFTRNTTDSLNLLAHSIPRRTTVVVFESEHHAALLPWERQDGVDGRTVVRLPVPALPELAVGAVDDALRRRAPGPALVVITGASNVTGELWPVAELARVAKARGARIALDAAQLAPHRRFSIAELGVDYVAVSGHKLYAPYGAGVLVGRSDWLDAAPPYLIGGGATATVSEAGTVYKTGPERHEAGSPNVAGAVALATACHALATSDATAREQAEAALTDTIRAGLAAIDGVSVHTLFSGAADSIGVVTFTVAGVPASIVAAALSAEHGIGVRDGAFCAHPLVRRLLGAAGCSDGTGPGQAVRVSVGLGSTTEHAERLTAAVADIATHGPRVEYVVVDGRPVPAEDDRPLPALAPWL